MGEERAAGGTTEAELARVRAYYDQTWYDYRLFWLNPRNRAIHFGYWGPGVRTHGESLLAMNRVLADAAEISSSDRVLDAGCGVGGSAIWLAAERGAQVVGITPVMSQVTRARRYARRGHLDHLTSFAQGDYLRTSFPDASFDVVWAQESVTHTDRKPDFFAEAHRLLRPGGRLVMADFFRWRRPYSEENERLIVETAGDWAAPDLPTLEEFTGWMHQAGFTDIRTRDLTPQVTRSLRRLYVVSTLMWPLGVAMRRARLRTEVQHRNLRGGRRLWMLLQRSLGHESLVLARRA